MLLFAKASNTNLVNRPKLSVFIGIRGPKKLSHAAQVPTHTSSYIEIRIRLLAKVLFNL